MKLGCMGSKMMAGAEAKLTMKLTDVNYIPFTLPAKDGPPLARIIS